MLENLKHIFKDVHGKCYVNLVIFAPVKLKGGKSNPQQNKIFKKMNIQKAITFANVNYSGYEKLVKDKLKAKGKDVESFKLNKRPWGERLDNLPIIEHKGNHYLEIILEEKPKIRYFIKDDLTGKFKEISKEKIIGLPETKKPKNDIIVRTIKFDNIKSLQIV